MNSVHISGNIGTEPEFRKFDGGKRKVSFSLAMNQYQTNGQQCDPIWIPCQAWDSVCDRLFKCQQKSKLSGRRISITGMLSQTKWTDQTTGKQHARLIIKVQSFEFFGGREQDQVLAQSSAGPQIESETAAEIVFDGKAVEPGNRRRLPFPFKSSELRSAREDSTS